mmetsp:Transcript_146647/g.258462  ORF Transcript_146647/g.258462 Transcript_146647/m.258462 type:complete len:430 (+) Transcript_146647:48-1337(+)
MGRSHLGAVLLLCACGISETIPDHLLDRSCDKHAKLASVPSRLSTGVVPSPLTTFSPALLQLKQSLRRERVPQIQDTENTENGSEGTSKNTAFPIGTGVDVGKSLEHRMEQAGQPRGREKAGMKDVKLVGIRRGLSYGLNRGLVNQRIILLGLLRYATYLDAHHLSLETLQWAVGWNVTTQVCFDELFDVATWNSVRLQTTGHRVRLPALEKHGNVSHWVEPEQCYSWGLPAFLEPDDALSKLLDLALRPAKPIQQVVDAFVRQASGPYGALHARIEKDLQVSAFHAFHRVPLRDVYYMLKEATGKYHCIRSLPQFFIAVSRDDVNDTDDAILLDEGKTPWQDSRLMFAGSKAAQKAGLNHTLVKGAIIDYEVSCRAAFFVGYRGLSSFAGAVINARRWRQSGQESCTFEYTKTSIVRPQLVHPLWFTG